MDVLNELRSVVTGHSHCGGGKEVLSFDDYCSLVVREPWVTRNSVQLMH